MPVALFKNLADYVSYPLSLLLNLSMSSGVVPSAWKRSIITPVFKKGDKSNPCNYRYISLTPVVCKIMEGIIKIK